jgi:ferric iron reductase protein FhuF
MIKLFWLLTTWSSTSAYLEWLVNELKMTANKTEYKDAHLVMLSADAINPHAR